MRRKKKKVLLFFIALLVSTSFFMPWVSVPKEIKKIDVISSLKKPKNRPLQNRFLFYSAKRIYLYSFSNGTLKRWNGYNLPSLLWKMEDNIVFGKFFWLSGKRGYKFYGLLLYMYPIILLGCLWILRRYKFSFLSRFSILLLCFSIVFIQTYTIGLKDISVMPVSGYLDYGYWIGNIGFFFFAIVVV